MTHNTYFLTTSKLVCNLNKSLYRLNQSPRAWFERIDRALKTLGMLRSSYDTNFYYLHQHLQMCTLTTWAFDWKNSTCNVTLEWRKNYWPTFLELNQSGAPKHPGAQWCRCGKARESASCKQGKVCFVANSAHKDSTPEIRDGVAGAGRFDFYIIFFPMMRFCVDKCLIAEWMIHAYGLGGNYVYDCISIRPVHLRSD